MMKVNIQLFADDYAGELVIGTDIDTDGIEEGGAKIKDVLERIFGKVKTIGTKAFKKIGDTILKLSKVTLKILGNTTRFLADLGLGSGIILVILGLFVEIAKAIELVLDKNESITANFQYLAFVVGKMITNIAEQLTGVIKSAIEWLINALYEILRILGLILNRIFGIDVFKDTGIDDFKKSMKESEKSAKAIKKELAGFDEMNVIGNNQGTGGSGKKIGTPTIEFPDMGGEVPRWLQWIFDHGDYIISIIAGIATALIHMKLFGISPIVALGIGVAMAGIVQLIQDLIKWIKHPTWRNFVDVLRDLSVILVGIGITMVAINAANPVGWILLAVGAIGLLIKNLDKVIAALGLDKARLLSVKKAHDQLTDAINATKRAQDAYISAVDNAEQAEKELVEAEKKHKLSGKELYAQVKDGVLNYKDMNTAQREVYKAYVNNKNAQEELTEATQELTQKTKEQKDAFWDEQISIATTSGEYDKLKEKIIDAVKNQELSVEEAQDLVSRAMVGMSKDTKKTFTEDMPNDIKDGLNPDKYDTVWSRFKLKWNQFFNGLNRNLTVKADLDTSAIKAHGLNYHTTKGAKGLMLYPTLPKLARGGIVSMPGRGITYGGATIAERGAEAVLPLTDSQQMALLGEAIGRYITVNASITNTMNGRVISRELQKVQNDSDFAYNR